MSAGDPLTLLLRDLDRPAQPRPEFTEELLTRLLGAPHPASAPTPPSRAPRRLRVALLAAAPLVLLAAVASAAYLATRSPAPPIRPASGQLTLPRADDEGNGPASIAAVGPHGRLTTLWRCAQAGFCGVITSLAWAPDGRHVAFSLTETGGSSAYIGLHIIDLASGKDLHIPNVPRLDPTKPQPDSVFKRIYSQAMRRLGCFVPTGLAWSPDSRSLAYACSSGASSVTPGVSRIFTIRADGSGRRALHTGVKAALWPTWSPDGTQIAFATAEASRVRLRKDTKDPYTTVRSSVFAMRLDGSHRRLLAADASAPSWSPDGTAIAFESVCGGIGLVSPTGAPLTPGAEPGVCAAIGHQGAPAWSPDGRRIAIAWRDRLYVMRADGSKLTRVQVTSGQTSYSTGRPAWAPGPTPTRELQQHADPAECGGSCL
jgi:WD40-like Beta Propeller Repeat